MPARGGEPTTLSAVADGGRFATITGARPTPERGVSIADAYVHADGGQLRDLVVLLAQRELEVPIGAVYPLEDAAEALALVTSRGARGAVVLSRNPPSASVVNVGRVRRTGVYWNRWLSRSVTRSENHFRTGRNSTALETASARRPLRRDCESDHSESFAGLVIRS
jgi:Zinc-binding dehydrogenase